MEANATERRPSLYGRSETAAKIGNLRLLRILPPDERRYLLMKIRGEVGHEKRAGKDAKRGIALCMWKGDYEGAMRFAKNVEVDAETGRDEKHAVAIGWVRTLVDCGRDEEAKALDDKHKVGIGTFTESRRAVAAERYGEERAEAMGKLEDAIKWGDGEAEGRIMQEHGLTVADEKLVLFYLLEEFGEHVLWKKELLGDKKFKGMGPWAYLWESGLGDVPFSRYREGYDATHSEHGERLIAQLRDVHPARVAGKITDDAHWMQDASHEVMAALVREGRYNEAKAVNRRSGMDEESEWGEVLRECATAMLAENPEWDVGRVRGALGPDAVAAIAVKAAMHHNCRNPRALAERFGVVERIRERGIRALAVGLAGNALYLVNGMGEGEAYPGIDAIKTKWGAGRNKGINIVVDGETQLVFAQKRCMEEGDVGRAGLLALRLIEGNADKELLWSLDVHAGRWKGKEECRRNAKLLLADALGLEGVKALLEMAAEMDG